MTFTLYVEDICLNWTGTVDSQIRRHRNPYKWLEADPMMEKLGVSYRQAY